MIDTPADGNQEEELIVRIGLLLIVVGFAWIVISQYTLQIDRKWAYTWHEADGPYRWSVHTLNPLGDSPPAVRFYGKDHVAVQAELVSAWPRIVRRLR